MRETEYYLAQAEFCAELAESVKRPDYKDRWLKTAEEWRDLAKQVEQGGEAYPDGVRRQLRSVRRDPSLPGRRRPLAASR